MLMNVYLMIVVISFLDLTSEISNYSTLVFPYQKVREANPSMVISKVLGWTSMSRSSS